MKRLIFVGICAMVWNAAWSQPQLVRDIASAPAGIFGNDTHANGDEFIVAGALMYFPVTDQKGRELWRTDGSPEGTFRVIDVNKGAPDSYMMGVAANTDFYFVTKPGPGESYSKLWRAAGLTSPTEFLINIAIDEGPADVRDLWVINNSLIIFATRGSKVVFIKYNPSDNATAASEISDDENVSLTNSVQINSLSRVFVLERFDGLTYESELWSINEGGTTKLTTYPDLIQNLSRRGEALDVLFSNSFNQVMSFGDGDVTLVQDFGTSSVNRIFPFIHNTSFIASTEGLWATNGTGATILLDVVNVNEIYVSGEKGYFAGYSQSDLKYRIYETDGTPEGTISLAEVQDSFDTPYFVSAHQIGVVRGKVVVPVTTPGTGMEIASITPNHADILKDINEGSASSDAHMFQVFGESLYFAANDGVNGMEVWVTDATPEGTVLLKNIAEGTANGVTTADLYSLNDEIYFDAYSSGSTHNVWRTKDRGGDAEEFFFTNSGTILGTANDSIYILTNPMSVYKSSGGEDPLLVADLTSDFGGAFHPSENFSLGDKFIYNMVTFGGHPYGHEFWTVDWHTTGTEVLKDIGPGLNDGVFGIDYGEEDHRVFVMNDSKALFAADDGTTGVELWITDGTAGGTKLIKDINPGTGSSSPRKIGAKLNNLVFFSADDGTHGDELWSTDGTAANTKMVADLNEDGSSNITDLATLGNAVYFVANLGLYKTTGSNATKISDVNSVSSGMVALDGKLYFGTEGKLWISDGSSTESFDIEGKPSNFYVFSGQVYFSSNEQLWHSKGTSALTRQVAEIDPVKFRQAGDLLFMTAYSKEYGLELFKMEQQKFTQDILFPAIAAVTLGVPDFSANATASSGLPVSYTAEGNVEITGNAVHMTAAGPVTITAHQYGDETFEAAEDVSQTFCVNPAKPVIVVDGETLTSSGDEGHQWYKDGVAIEGAIDKTFTMTEVGEYTVQITIQGCVSEMSEAGSIITGLGDEPSRISIYPNPAARLLFVSKPAQLKIIDSNGRVAFSDFVSESVDVSSYSKGLYIAIVDNAHSIKFIKK